MFSIKFRLKFLTSTWLMTNLLRGVNALIKMFPLITTMRCSVLLTFNFFILFFLFWFCGHLLFFLFLFLNNFNRRKAIPNSMDSIKQVLILLNGLSCTRTRTIKIKLIYRLWWWSQRSTSVVLYKHFKCRQKCINEYNGNKNNN